MFFLIFINTKLLEILLRNFDKKFKISAQQAKFAKRFPLPSRGDTPFSNGLIGLKSKAFTQQRFHE